MTRNSKKLVCGKGTKGDGVSKVKGKHTESYKTWVAMLARCYSTKYQASYPTYIGCSVCDEWLYYPTFKSWFDKNYVGGWHLDKDLLLAGNKEYAPDTCVFVPQQINKLFTDHGGARGEYPIGVCFHKEKGKFTSLLRIDGRRKTLGYFDDPNEAHKTYLVAKRANVIRMANEWKDKIPPKLYEVLIRKANELF